MEISLRRTHKSFVVGLDILLYVSLRMLYFDLLRSTRLQFLLYMHALQVQLLVTSVRVSDRLPLVTIPSATAKNRTYPIVVT